MSSQYVNPSDLANYITPSVLQPINASAQLQACIDASEVADSYMRGRYALPLVQWGSDIRRNTAYVAIYLLLQGRGFNPAAGADRLIVERYYSAVGWPDKPGTGFFPGIQRQAIHPDVTPSMQPGADPIHDAPQVSTQQMRGWQDRSPITGKPVVGGF
jgi:phage gp36-like protein